MRWMALVAVLGVGLTHPVAVRAAEPAALDGLWEVAVAEVDGAAVPALVGAKLLVAGQRMVLRLGETTQVSQIRLNVAEVPHEIDATDRAGSTSRGIFQVTGDELVLCFALPGDEVTRPADFVTSPGSGRMRFECRREVEAK